MPKAVFQVEQTKLAKSGEQLLRIATRLPEELRRTLKVHAAVMGVALNALYAVALREFLALAIYADQPVEWKQPRTSPRADRHGAPRGDPSWVQVLMILPEPLIRELEGVAAEKGQSLASFAYTALDWYVVQQEQRQQALSTLQGAKQLKRK